MDKKIKILGIGGSLRNGSFSKIVLNSLVNFTTDEVEIEIYQDLASIPMFNQDLETNLPDSVIKFKAMIKAADAILFVTPEYNYSIPGYLKNAMDWASRPYGDNSFNDKPASIICVSTGILGGSRALYALRQSGISLNIHFLNRPEAIVTNVQEKINEGKLVDEQTLAKISDVIKGLVEWTKRIGQY
jgi:chromate reductase